MLNEQNLTSKIVYDFLAIELLESDRRDKFHVKSCREENWSRGGAIIKRNWTSVPRDATRYLNSFSLFFFCLLETEARNKIIFNTIVSIEHRSFYIEELEE